MVTETAGGYVLENDHARFDIACDEGFALRQVTDVASGTDLLAESPYFDGVPLSLRSRTGRTRHGGSRGPR